MKFWIKLLSKFASADEVPGASGAQNRSVHEVLEDSSTGATQQFAAEVEFQKKFIYQHPVMTSSVAIAMLSAVLLFVNTLHTFFSYRQTAKAYHAVTRETKKLDQEIASLSKTLSKFQKKAEPESLLPASFLRSCSDYQIAILPEVAALTPAQFQDYLRKRVSALKNKSLEQKGTLPENFFLGLNQYESHLPLPDALEKLEQQEILLSEVAERLLSHPEIKVEQFDLEELPVVQKPSSLLKPLDYLLLSVTTEEVSFQKLFNELVNNRYFFIIETMNVVNSKPLSPLHAAHQLANAPESGMEPLLGREKITVTLKINLLNVSSPLKQKESKLLWEHHDKGSPLFTARHCILKNGSLVDLLEEPILLHPPVPNEWLIKYHLDYCNPNILLEDPDHDGFNNLEEWLGSDPIKEPGKFSSNPNDPNSHPLLWTKLTCHQNDILSHDYDFYFTGYDPDASEKIFQLQPKTATPNIDRHGHTVLNTKIRYVKMGERLEGLPLQVLSYEEKKVIYKDITYDSSVLRLFNPETKEEWSLVKKSTLHPEATRITTRDGVRFHNNLFSPSTTIDVKRGDCFSLESPEKKQGQEWYQLVDISNNAVIIKKDNRQYSVPIDPSEKSNSN